MMIPLENLSIYEKAPTRLDSEVAQFVKMDISYDLDSIPFDRYKQEWDQIVENDILFLLSIQVRLVIRRCSAFPEDNYLNRNQWKKRKVLSKDMESLQFVLFK